MRKIVIALAAVLVCSVSAIVPHAGRPNYNKLAQAVSDNLNSETANNRQSLI